MADENTDDKNSKDADSITLESLAKQITDNKTHYEGVIETLKEANINTIAQLTKSFDDKSATMSEDMQNLTNLLGGLANKDDKGEDEDEGEISRKDITDIANKAVSDNDTAKTRQQKETNDAYWNEYVETTSEMMEDEGPDDKSLTKEARAGILEIIKKNPDMVKTKNATRDAQKNHRKATRIYFGIGKEARENPFKGGDVNGSGGGSGNSGGSGSKKTYTLNADQKAEIKMLGETEEWGIEQLEKRAAAAAV